MSIACTFCKILTGMTLFFFVSILSLNGQTVYEWSTDGQVFLKLSKEHYSLETIPRLAEGRTENEGIRLSSLPFLEELRSKYEIRRLTRPFQVAKSSDTLQMTYLLEFDKIHKVDALLDRLNQHEEIAYAERVPYHKAAFVPNDPNYGQQYGINNMIKAQEAWDISKGNSNIKVAITDNSIDIDHEDLSSIVVASRDVADQDNDPRPNNNENHGTHVSGIATAITDNNTGVASIGAGVSLMAVKISPDGQSGLSAGYQGIAWAANNGADVINMSWGGFQQCASCKATVDNAVNQGAVLVAGAGNSSGSSKFYPAAYTNVIAVGSSNSNDQQSNFSQFGPWVDAVAPGSQILSTTPNDNYQFLSGTSMASPMVAGLAGLILSLNPNLSVSQVRNCIEATGDNIGFTGGALRINAEQALLCANPSSPPNSDFSANNTNACPGSTIQFSDQSTGNVNSYSWNFPGGTPSSSTSANPAVTYNSTGTFDVILTTTNSNGSDTETKTGFITISNSGTEVIFEDDFESGSFSTKGWNINNPDNSITWATTNVSGNTPGNQAAWLNFFDYNNADGERDELITPTLDFSNNSNIQLEFEHAHRRFNQNIADSLIISVSTDGGATFPDRILATAENGSGNFATNTTTNNNFVPSNADDWCFGGSIGASCFTLDLSNYDGQSNVKLKFETVNDFGNNLYVDNVEITGTCSSPGQGPNADFTASQTTITAGNSIDFTDLSSGNINSWSWTFNGAATTSSTQQNPTNITYNNPGTFDVSLTVNGNNGSDTETKTGYINVVPQGGGGSGCDSILHIDSQDTLALFQFQNQGYVSGHNGFGIDAFADSFTVNQTGMQVTKVNLAFGVAQANSQNGKITVHVWDETGGVPGSSLGSKDVPISDISNDVSNQQTTSVDFSSNPVSISGDFFVGFTINYGTGDTVAVITNRDGNSTPATAWSRFMGSWLNYGDTSYLSFDASHFIQPVFCANSGSGCSGLSVSTSSTDENCNLSDGSVSASASGGTTPYSYNWSNGASGSSVNNLSAGTYTVTVTDANNCTVTDNVTLGTIGGPNVSLGSKTNVSCNGGSDGSITVNASGGTTPYSYTWSNLVSTPTNNNLSAGAYSVTVTDANQCTDTGSFTITEPPVINISVSSTDANCGQNDGSATANVSNGTPPYSFNWSNGSTSQTANNLSSGTYSLTVVDDNGCTETASVKISSTGGPTLTTSNKSDVSCNGASDGSVTVSAIGGTSPYTYTWSNGQSGATANNLIAGSYTVTVFDNFQCSATKTINISEPSSINVSSTTSPANCNQANGSASVSASNGSQPFSYQWSTGSTSNSISGVTAGSYTVTITDANNCAQVKTVNVGNSNGPNLSTNVSDVTCNGVSNGSVNLSITGGAPPLTYSWSNGDVKQDLSNVPAGNYTVTVTDGNNCITTQSVTVTQPPAINVVLIESDESCGNSNGSVNANSSGGTGAHNYMWSNGMSGSSINNLSAGNYSVTVTDANGCTATKAVSILGTPDVEVSFNNVANDPCGQGSGSVTAVPNTGQAPFSYSWSNGANIAVLNNLTAGEYVLTVTDDNGCQEIDSVEIQGSDSLSVTTSSTPDTSSTGQGTASVSANGGTAPYSYSWSNGATGDSLTGLAAGTYTVTITDANNCSETKTVSVSNVVGIEERSLDQSLSIYPNPNQGQFKIELNTEASAEYEIELYNALGERVYADQDAMLGQNAVHTVDVGQKAPGIYLLQLSNSQSTISKRIVIQQ